MAHKVHYFHSPFLAILLLQAIILLFAITTPNNYFVVIAQLLVESPLPSSGSPLPDLVLN
jgi:hypothetical protein